MRYCPPSHHLVELLATLSDDDYAALDSKLAILGYSTLRLKLEVAHRIVSWVVTSEEFNRSKAREQSRWEKAHLNAAKAFSTAHEGLKRWAQGNVQKLGDVGSGHHMFPDVLMLGDLG